LQDNFVGADLIVPHDDIHLQVMYGKQPIYETMKRDLTKATVERDLFEKAPHLTQLRCVREEAMSIAIERYLFPTLVRKFRELQRPAGFKLLALEVGFALAPRSAHLCGAVAGRGGRNAAVPASVRGGHSTRLHHAHQRLAISC
jgi:hypothetical protein